MLRLSLVARAGATLAVEHRLLTEWVLSCGAGALSAGSRSCGAQAQCLQLLVIVAHRLSGARGIFPDQGLDSVSPAMAAGFFTIETREAPLMTFYHKPRSTFFHKMRRIMLIKFKIKNNT